MTSTDTCGRDEWEWDIIENSGKTSWQKRMAGLVSETYGGRVHVAIKVHVDGHCRTNGKDTLLESGITHPMQPGLSPREASTSVSCLLEEVPERFLDDRPTEYHLLHVADFLPPRHHRLTAARLLVLTRGCQARRARTNLDLNHPEDQLSPAASRSARWKRSDRESSGLALSHLHQARQVHRPSSVGGT